MSQPLPLFIFLVSLAALVSGCRTAPQPKDISTIEGASHASVHVLFDNTRSLPLSGTFGWGMSMVRVDSGVKDDLSVITERLHRSLLATLSEKGFTYAGTNPDYSIGFAVLVGTSLDEAELNRAYGASLVFPKRVGDSPAVNYSAGVLIVDIVRRSDGHLLWRGAIKADIDLALEEERKQARCDGAVRELLRHYPVAAK